MKSNSNRIAILVLLALLTISCEKDFLEVKNPNEITADVFFEDATQVEQAVNTLYNSIAGALRGDGDQSIFTQNARGGGSVVTAGAFQTQVNYFNYGSSPQDNDSDSFWNGAYTTIFRANTILENIDGADFGGDEATKQRLLAETYFFRGVSYFQLAHLYGAVPIVLNTPVSDEDFNPPVAGSFGEVWDQAIADLLLAKAGLPTAENAPEGRITWGSATGFLGKTYLYRAGYLNEAANYALAAAEFQQIIDSGTYELVTNFRDNFTSENENNTESLYEFQYFFSNQETATQSRPFNSVPGIGFEIFLRPSPWLMNEMSLERTVGDEFDPRYLEAVYFNEGLPLFGVPYNELGEGLSCDGGGAPDGSSDTEGGWWRKYLNVHLACPPELEGSSDPDNNERILRYADILLMHAEALVASGGDLTAALESVNVVRRRANLSDYADTATLLDEIKHQRAIEFAYENLRYFDLIRWGELESFVAANGTATQQANVGAKHKYFPIPVDEVTNNSNLEQSEPWR
nr:RagB/SusD family nutrient uptake outer membrane protein [Allomuricauda sp.]